jgi:hypothetical protein
MDIEYLCNLHIKGIVPGDYKGSIEGHKEFQAALRQFPNSVEAVPYEAGPRQH